MFPLVKLTVSIEEGIDCQRYEELSTSTDAPNAWHGRAE